MKKYDIFGKEVNIGDNVVITDEQIIKAVEVCRTIDTCRSCPYHELYAGECVCALMKDVFDLINRQKARIKELEEKHAEDERVLNDRVQELVNAVSKADQKYICTLERSIAAKDVERERLLQKLQQAQSEAIKGFAERLKNKIWYNPACNRYRTITPDDIYDLARKMMEE